MESFLEVTRGGGPFLQCYTDKFRRTHVPLSAGQGRSWRLSFRAARCHKVLMQPLIFTCHVRWRGCQCSRWIPHSWSWGLQADSCSHLRALQLQLRVVSSPEGDGGSAKAQKLQSTRCRKTQRRMNKQLGKGKRHSCLPGLEKESRGRPRFPKHLSFIKGKNIHTIRGKGISVQIPPWCIFLTNVREKLWHFLW